MNLEEYISYKTFFYFFKDDPILDLDLYVDKTSDFQNFIDNGYKDEDFAEVYSKAEYDSYDIVYLKTNRGVFLFHGGSKHEYVMDFLEKATQNTAGAFFATHRVSDTHQIGIAENGELKRYLYYGEDGHILEGDEQTPYEKKKKIKFKLDEDEFFVNDIDEETVYNYASDFMKFDRTEDLKILDFKYYSYEPFSTLPEYDSNIDDNIIYQIHDNLEKQGLEDISFYFTKYEEDDMIDCSCIVKENETIYYVFSKIIKNIKKKKDFKDLLFSCLKALATCNFREYTKSPLQYYLHAQLLQKVKYDMCTLIVDNEDKGSLAVSLTMKKSEKLYNEQIVSNMKNIENFKLKNYKIIYKYLLKNMTI